MVARAHVFVHAVAHAFAAFAALAQRGLARVQQFFVMLDERLAGRAPKAALPDNLCYMMVNGSPREAISVQIDYTLNAQGVIEQTQIDDNDRRAELVSENFKWAGYMFDEMFG